MAPMIPMRGCLAAATIIQAQMVCKVPGDCDFCHPHDAQGCNDDDDKPRASDALGDVWTGQMKQAQSETDVQAHQNLQRP